ncbi:MAG: signal peptidase I [Desulfobacterales bacterium]|nr:signal peptidase I [Desulfobacterales bacterium]
MDAANKPRKPWIAGLLSLLTIGFGHVYAGRAGKGLFLYFIPKSLIGAVCLSILIFLPTPGGLIVCVVLVCALSIYCIADAMRIARQNKEFYSPKRYNRWYVYLLILVFAGFVVQPLSGAIIKKYIVQAYRIPSGAMQQTLQVGDHILTKKALLFGPPVKRGDIVIFPYPVDPEKDFIKRVVGLGGERLEIRDKQVYINDQAIEEPYKIHVDGRTFAANQQPRDNFGPIEIPPDAIFVMGDNRDESNDSRFWGFVPAESVSAKAHSIYWSWDKEAFNVRWSRVGTMIP